MTCPYKHATLRARGKRWLKVHPETRLSAGFQRAPAIVLCIPGLIISGCAAVNPRPDMQRAAGEIRNRTGSTEVYDPEAQGPIEDRIDEFLEGGFTVDEAVSVALLNNARLQATFMEIGASRADVVQAGLWSNPILSLSVRFPEGGGRSNLTAGFAQQIVDLWQIPVRKRIAQDQLEQAILSLVGEAVRLTSEVRRSFYEVMALERTEELLREHLALVDRSLKLSQARFDAGEISEVDVNLIRNTVVEAQIETISLSRDRQRGMNALTREMGLSRLQTALTLSGSWPDERPIPDDNAALVAALQQRLDVRAAGLRMKAAKAELVSEYRNVFPNVTVGLEGERLERRAIPGRTVAADALRASIANGGLTAPSIQSRAERRRERSQIIDLLLGPTLEITLPIWDQNQAKIAKACYKLRQQRALFEDLLDSVAQDVADAVSAARAASELVHFFEEKALPQARASVEAARQGYEAGEQNVLALIDAQKTLISQQRAHITALRDRAMAQAELERAMGGRPVDAEPSYSEPSPSALSPAAAPTASEQIAPSKPQTEELKGTKP